MADILIEARTGRIARLTLNRGPQRNALSLELTTVLREAIQRLGKAPDVHVIILAANGPAFCAGHDLKEIAAARAADDGGRAFFEKAMTGCSALMQSIVSCPKPVIAEVHAMATAAGCQLVASCDLALASDVAHFATPGVNIGLFCSTPMVALSRNVGRKASMEMLLTGDAVGADRARELGLVNRVVAPDALSDETFALAEQIAAKSPTTLRIGKEAFYAQAEMPLAAAYDYASEVMVTNLLERDAKEGIGAFIEKRPPEWEPLG